MEKIVSQFDAAGYLVGPVAADPSPLEPGVWLLPAGAVDVEPIEQAEGFRYRMEAGEWIAEALPVEEVAPVDPVAVQ